MSLKEFESFIPLDDNYHNHEFYADLKSLVIIYPKGKEPVVFNSKKRYDEEMKRISKLPATKKQKALIKAYAVAYYEDTPFKPSLAFIDKITMKQATDFIERLFKFFYHLSSNPNPIPKPFYDGGAI